MSDTMRDKVCLITGATSGIGKATAFELARAGAHLVLVARNPAKGDATRTAIIAQTGNTRVDVLLCDLAEQAQVRRLASEVIRAYPRLHVLINDAGVTLTKRSLTPDAIEQVLAVNHLAPFLLTHLLLDLLKASAPARVVVVGSEAQAAGHIHLDDLSLERHYKEMVAYNQSKLANLLFTYELARRLDGSSVTVNCVHPGAVRTNFGHDSGGAMGLIVRVARPFELSPERGAETVVYLAASPDVEGQSGLYWAHKQPKRSSAESYDADVRLRLWDESARLTGLQQTVTSVA